MSGRPGITMRMARPVTTGAPHATGCPWPGCARPAGAPLQPPLQSATSSAARGDGRRARRPRRRRAGASPARARQPRRLRLARTWPRLSRPARARARHGRPHVGPVPRIAMVAIVACDAIARFTSAAVASRPSARASAMAVRTTSSPASAMDAPREQLARGRCWRAPERGGAGPHLGSAGGPGLGAVDHGMASSWSDIPAVAAAGPALIRGSSGVRPGLGSMRVPAARPGDIPPTWSAL